MSNKVKTASGWVDLSSAVQAFLDDVDAATMRATTGAQPADADLDSLAASGSTARAWLQALLDTVYQPLDANLAADIWFPAKMMDVTQGAANYSVGVLGSSGKRTGALMMDDGTAGTNEFGMIHALIPRSWTTFAVDVWWAIGTANTGDVVWQAQYTLLIPGTTVDSEVAGSNTTATAPATNVIAVTTLATPITRGSAQVFRCEVGRIGSAAGDTLTGDAGLLGVMLRKVS
jgi:hypothetical protein